MTCLPAATLLLTALLMGFDSLGQQRPGLPADTEISRRSDGTPELVRFANPATAPAATDAARVLRTTLGLGTQTELRATRPAETDEMGITHQRYQQFYQGLPVEFSAYNTLSRNGKLEVLNGDLHPLADGALNVQPTLTAAQALPAALRFVHAQKYMWQLPNEGKFARETEGKATFRPTGELVIVSDDRTETAGMPGKSVLAWKFDIYAAQPDSRAWIYVDAHTGAVVNRDAISQEVAATATFTTKYSGTRQLANQTLSGLSFLSDNTRGLGIETINSMRTNTAPVAHGLYDSNNVWTAAEYNNANQDWVGGDTHFGAQQTYDYWKLVHGRNSFDNAGAKLKSYYHFDTTPGDGIGWTNARWNGSVMLYGDGSGVNYSALTTVDICGHEMGHAICKYTANLKYFRESGALNEGFSDIWGACIENRAAGLYNLPNKNTWLIAEEIYINGGYLRSMSNPNAKNQPDTYGGNHWVFQSAASDTVDNGGVHTNSGVLNYWFYLVSQGGSGTNDKGNLYNVTGLGITKAAKIAYLTEKMLTQLSDFATARSTAIQAATTLYGVNSLEVRTVTNAWFAVGVGNANIAYGTGNTSYIDLVSLNNLVRSSGSDGGYYGLFIGNMMPTLARCSQQTLLHSAGFTGAITTQYWNVWVDYNNDGDFSEAGERVITNKVVVNNAGFLASQFVVPPTATLGYCRMRVAMGSLAINSPCGSVGAGEVEDYLVKIAAAAPLAMPANLQATNVMATGADITWTFVPGAVSYRVSYRLNTAGTWMTGGVAAPFTARTLGGLQSGKIYQYFVEAIDHCGTAGLASATQTFVTPAARPTGTSPDQSTAPASLATATAYPNPATDVLRLTLTDATGAETSPATVDVFDLRGARLLNAAYDGNSGTLRVGTLAPGLYTATLRSAVGTPVHVRFVKE